MEPAQRPSCNSVMLSGVVDEAVVMRKATGAMARDQHFNLLRALFGHAAIKSDLSHVGEFSSGHVDWFAPASRNSHRSK